jgi:SPP1 gp7 family putative phage head morphogenesis protein
VASPQPAPDQPGPSGVEIAVIATLETALLEGALVAGTAIPLYLILRLTALGIDRRAARAALRLGLTDPVHLPRRLRTLGTAAAKTAAAEPGIRARYIVDAAKRITKSLTVLGDDPHALGTAIRAERRFFRQHLDATRNRRRAAQAVDRVARTSPWLIWTTANDARVEPECRGLAGTLFTIDQPPVVDGRPVWPGSVHPHCRCTASAFGATPIRAQPTVTAS